MRAKGVVRLAMVVGVVGMLGAMFLAPPAAASGGGGCGRAITEAAGTAVRVPNAEREPTRPAQLLGADTDAVLGDVLGMGEGEIGRLHDAGIVAGPNLDPSASRM